MSLLKPKLNTLFLDKIDTNENEIILKVRSPKNKEKCSYCLATCSKIHKYTNRKIKHMIINNKIVFLDIKIKFFKCKECKKIFREYIPNISNKSFTDNYLKSAIKNIKDISFASIAKEYNISASTLIRNTTQAFSKHSIKWPDSEFCLGIDEHSFSGRDLVITITDLTNRKVLAILEDHRQTTLRQFINNIPENIKVFIKGVCIDMKISYRKVIEKELGNLILVTDKFHVIQHLNFHLQELRLLFTSSSFPLPKQLLEKNKEDLNKIEIEKEKLKIIFNKYPALEEFWKMKEIIRKMYKCKRIKKAKMYYDSLLDGLEFDCRRRWQKLFRTLKKWHDLILNYFKLRITNGFTEGCHTKIKTAKRISYGFRNKTNYIAKMTIAFLPITAIIQLLASPSLT